MMSGSPPREQHHFKSQTSKPNRLLTEFAIRAMETHNNQQGVIMPTTTVRQNRKSTSRRSNNSRRSYVFAQNLMEGDEFVMRGEPNTFVAAIRRNETKGTVNVTFTNGNKRRYSWNNRALIMETNDRNLYRRNSLRRNGYRNYFDVLDAKIAKTSTKA